MADKTKPEPLNDADLDDASGGLPAVQKVREAAARTTTSSLTKDGPGTLAVNSPASLSDAQLDEANGGLIGLLLPAVQKVREAAGKLQEPDVTGGPHVKSADGSV